MGGVYLHIPFCASKCPYCDFYSYRGSEEEREAYVSALLDEIVSSRRAKAYLKEPFCADTLYLGGGTPSVLTGRQLYELVITSRKAFSLPENAEITVECNPASVLEEVLPFLHEAGVNRISLGMQSAVDSERRVLGRRADSRRVGEAVELCRKNGIENISLDLMLGIPHQTEKSLSETLQFVKEEAVPHVSAYLLQLEEGTPFFRRQKELALPDEDSACTLYEQCEDTLLSFGLCRYEISNYARPGFESRHNLKYWLSDDYLGIGAAAHSFINGKRFFYPHSTADFLLGSSPVGDGEGGTEEEYILLRLRLAEGILLSNFSARYGEEEEKELIKKALPLIGQGLLNNENGKLFLTRRGVLLSNSVIAELI